MTAGTIAPIAQTFDLALPADLAETALPADLAEEMLNLLEKARAANTRRAYRASVARFIDWCAKHGRRPMPASAETVAAFLTAEAERGIAPGTVSLQAAAIAFAHRTAAIAFAHRAAELPNPCAAPLVLEILRGIRNNASGAGRRIERAAALTADRLAVCLATLDRSTLQGTRDAALLALGFALAARRSELEGLDLADVADDGEGLSVTIHRSKTDQTGKGAVLHVPTAANPQLCAVRAVRAWIKAAGLEGGALFRSVTKGGAVGSRLTGRSVDLVVRRVAAAAGIASEGRYSAHSLRAGLVTTLAERGRTEAEIMRQSRHQSSAMVRVYSRHHDAKATCPLRGAF